VHVGQVVVVNITQMFSKFKYHNTFKYNDNYDEHIYN